MTRFDRFHVGAYRRLVRVMPRPHRDRHGLEQVQLFADLLATGTSPWRLWARAVPDLVVAGHNVHGRSAVVSTSSRLALVPLSFVSAGAGLALLVAALVVGDIPTWVALPAVAVSAQGVFTLLWLGGRLRHAPTASRAGFIMGESGVLLIGGVALVAAIVAQAAAGDPEYGPLTLLTLVVVHAAVGLLFVAVGDDPAAS